LLHFFPVQAAPLHRFFLVSFPVCLRRVEIQVFSHPPVTYDFRRRESPVILYLRASPLVMPLLSPFGWVDAPFLDQPPKPPFALLRPPALNPCSSTFISFPPPAHRPSPASIPLVDRNPNSVPISTPHLRQLSSFSNLRDYRPPFSANHPFKVRAASKFCVW